MTGGGGGNSICAGHVLLAPQTPYPIVVYSPTNYDPILCHIHTNKTRFIKLGLAKCNSVKENWRTGFYMGFKYVLTCACSVSIVTGSQFSVTWSLVYYGIRNGGMWSEKWSSIKTLLLCYVWALCATRAETTTVLSFVLNLQQTRISKQQLWRKQF